MEPVDGELPVKTLLISNEAPQCQFAFFQGFQPVPHEVTKTVAAGHLLLSVQKH